MGDEKIDPIE